MDQTIGRMITLLARKSQTHIGDALRKYDLTAAEQPFFMALQHYEGVTQEELTAIVCVDKAATARAVKSLERKGYLIRVQDEHDRRRNRVYPTGAAKRLADAVNGELLHFNGLLTQGIDPQSLESVYAALLKMAENLEGISGSHRGGAEQEEEQNGTQE